MPEKERDGREKGAPALRRPRSGPGRMRDCRGFIESSRDAIGGAFAGFFEAFAEDGRHASARSDLESFVNHKGPPAGDC